MNFKFQEDVKGKSEENSNKTFLEIDTWTLRKVHTSFKKGISKLPLGIDHFALHSYADGSRKIKNVPDLAQLNLRKK